MITTEWPEVTDILDRVRVWPPEKRVTLAHRILQSISDAEPTPRKAGYWAAEVIAALQMPQPAPDDATVKRWIDEGRLEKYGT